MGSGWEDEGGIKKSDMCMCHQHRSMLAFIQTIKATCKCRRHGEGNAGDEGSESSSALSPFHVRKAVSLIR